MGVEGVVGDWAGDVRGGGVSIYEKLDLYSFFKNTFPFSFFFKCVDYPSGM